MIRIDEHLQAIEKAKADLQKAKSPMRRRDLKKHIYRMQRQLILCRQNMEKAV